MVQYVLACSTFLQHTITHWFYIQQLYVKFITRRHKSISLVAFITTSVFNVE